ncbi:MAG: methyltransferase domain-containing protein [Parcubacteria group bacterium]|nr:methyltransferase domain-containing protein [Parcubacteria group bacterium]
MPIDPPTPSPKFIDPDSILDQLQVKENNVVADLGCGSGYYAFAAAKKVGEEGKVYAVDIQKTVLSALQSKIKLQGTRNITAVWADIEVPGSTKIAASSVDFTLLAAIFYQTQKHEQILIEAKRITKDKGKIVIIDWKSTNVPLGPQTELRVSKDVIRRQAEAIGLKFSREINVGSYHYGLVFEK